MPHVNVKHFPADLGDERLAIGLTAVVTECFPTYDDAVSIALEPVPPSDWQGGVYEPEILGRADLLIKAPRYRASGQRGRVHLCPFS